MTTHIGKEHKKSEVETAIKWGSLKQADKYITYTVARAIKEWLLQKRHFARFLPKLNFTTNQNVVDIKNHFE